MHLDDASRKARVKIKIRSHANMSISRAAAGTTRGMLVAMGMRKNGKPPANAVMIHPMAAVASASSTAILLPRSSQTFALQIAKAVSALIEGIPKQLMIVLEILMAADIQFVLLAKGTAVKEAELARTRL